MPDDYVTVLSTMRQEFQRANVMQSAQQAVQVRQIQDQYEQTAVTCTHTTAGLCSFARHTAVAQWYIEAQATLRLCMAKQVRVSHSCWCTYYAHLAWEGLSVCRMSC